MTRIAPNDASILPQTATERKRTSVLGDLGVLAFVLITLLISNGSWGQATRPAAEAPSLLAVGSASSSLDAVWAARISRVAGKAETQILLGKGNDFQQIGFPLTGAAISIAPVGMQLAVLLEDGEWVLVSDSGLNVAPSFDPAIGKLLSFAADADGLHALGRITGELTLKPGDPLKSPASKAGSNPVATAGTRAATGPSTAVAATSKIALLRYHLGQWIVVSELPREVARSFDAVSLAVQEKTPVVLVRDAPDALRLWRVDANEWTPIGRARIAASARSAQLVTGGPMPAAHVISETASEADRVLVFGISRSNVGTSTLPSTGPSNPLDGRPPVVDIRLETTQGVPPGGRAAAFLPGGPFRSVVLAGDRLKTQTYDRMSLLPIGNSVTADVQELPSHLFELIEGGIVLAAMLFAIWASYRRREQVRALELEPEDLPLVPMGVRMLAGLIDAVPLLIALFYSLAANGTDLTSNAFGLNWINAIGLAVYLLHTTLEEVFAGRSVGKMICGLRVVSIDGSAPTRVQLLIRNLLRVIDVLLKFFPLILVAFSPLRQRAGDAAAGTLVVTTEPKPQQEAREE